MEVKAIKAYRIEELQTSVKNSVINKYHNEHYWNWDLYGNERNKSFRTICDIFGFQLFDYDDSYGVVSLPWMIYMKYQDQYELVPNKFDPKTLQPFNKVLVRDCESDMWKVDFYSHKDADGEFPYVCIGSPYTYCIPYNDETKQLAGTTDEAPEYYRYWED